MTRKEEAIEHLRNAAHILEGTGGTVHLPDDYIFIQESYFNRVALTDSGQDVAEYDIADLLQYLADMMED